MNCLRALGRQVAFFHVYPSSKISAEARFAKSETEEAFGLKCEHRPAHLDHISETAG